MREDFALFLAGQVGAGGWRGQIKLRCVARMLGQGSQSLLLGSLSRSGSSSVWHAVVLSQPFYMAARIFGRFPHAESVPHQARLPENSDPEKAKICKQNRRRPATLRAGAGAAGRGGRSAR